jgi:hypothetical protein
MSNAVFYLGTATVSWFDSSGGLHIRVYSTDGDNVTERCSDAGGPGWTTGAFAQPGAAVSATVWNTSSGTSIRVYCTVGGVTTEWCNDPGKPWYQGSFTPA